MLTRVPQQSRNPRCHNDRRGCCIQQVAFSGGQEMIGSIHFAAGLATVGLAFCAPAYAASDDAALVEKIRAASERFQDVDVALKEGYMRDPANMCVTAEMEGQPAERGEMGIHYFRPDLLGITGTTHGWREPEPTSISRTLPCSF